MTSPTPDALVLARPLLRGVLHEVGLVVAAAVGALLIAGSDVAHVAEASVFAASVVVTLGTSTLYHRITWKPTARAWMRRADHAGVYVLIAGTYTPVGLISLHGPVQALVLGVVWFATAAAALTEFAWRAAPKWFSIPVGIAIGWAGLIAVPQLERSLGTGAVALLAAGGVAYTVGAIILATRRPDPAPRVFGYHELFHAFTLVAIACQYAAIAFFVLDVA
jgi:hemolysin III